MHSHGKLVLVLPNGQEQEYALAKSNVAVGRSTINDIVLRDTQVASSHARIECGDGGCTLVDLESAGGTRVNGARVERVELASGDVIALGTSLLRFETSALQSILDVTPIHTEVDLETMLARAKLPMLLGETLTPRLVVHTSARTWEVPLLQETVTIGSAPGSDIVIADAQVSPQHARLERRRDDVVLRDLNSREGTWLHGGRVHEGTLQAGETFRIGGAQFIFKPGFAAQDLALAAPQSTVRSDVAARLPVVVVPGLMGSQLWRGSERIWPRPGNLFTSPEIYSFVPDQPLEARGVVDRVVIVPNLIRFDAYNRLGDYLVESLGYARDKDLFEFAYDWREDIGISAQRLAQAIERWNVQPPFALLAHNLGCMVGRYYVERLGGKERVARLLLMGDPHQGVPKFIASLLSSADLMPFGLLGERLRQMLMTFPSMYQLLPNYPCAFDQAGHPIDLLGDETWIPAAHVSLLRRAREFRRELGRRSAVSARVPTVSIFGYGLETMTNTHVERDAAGQWHKIDFGTEARGDALVAETRAAVEGAAIYPVAQYHGSLYVDNDVKLRLKQELVHTRG